MTFGNSQSLFCALIYALSLNPKLEYLTSILPSLWSEVYYPVGTSDDVEIVLNDDLGVAGIIEFADNLEETFNIVNGRTVMTIPVSELLSACSLLHKGCCRKRFRQLLQNRISPSPFPKRDCQ